MSQSAFQIQYRQEFIEGFEQRQTLLRDTVVTEAVIKGNQATFLVADSGGATTVTRGLNGLIPPRSDNLNQYTATLTEEHDLVERTNFNLFASQGDGKRIMQETSMSVVNRKIDQQIITELNTATNDTGTATTASLNMIAKSLGILGNLSVPITDGQLTALITPSFLTYLIQVKEFASANYVDAKPMAGNNLPAWKDRPKMYQWLNVNWIVHPNLPGVGTAAEKCFLYHKNSLGHASNTSGIDSQVDYDRKQDLSWARTTLYMGAKLLQNSGVLVMNHDGSAIVAQ